MSRPDEEERAIVRAGNFLEALADPRQTRRVPSEIRRAAESILRHYPMPARTELLFRDVRKGATK